EAIKPVDDLARLADSIRQRLAAIAAAYAKLGLKPEPPPPTRETYSKFADPVDELFTRLSRMDTPLKLLEGLIIPKTMKGAREAWVFVFVLLLMGTLIAMAGGEWPALVGALAAGAALAALLRMGLVQLSRTQLERYYIPLT